MCMGEILTRYGWNSNPRGWNIATNVNPCGVPLRGYWSAICLYDDLCMTINVNRCSQQKTCIKFYINMSDVLMCARIRHVLTLAPHYTVSTPHTPNTVNIRVLDIYVNAPPPPPVHAIPSHTEPIRNGHNPKNVLRTNYAQREGPQELLLYRGGFLGVYLLVTLLFVNMAYLWVCALAVIKKSGCNCTRSVIEHTNGVMHVVDRINPSLCTNRLRGLPYYFKQPFSSEAINRI